MEWKGKTVANLIRHIDRIEDIKIQPKEEAVK